jgi:uncharacterized glyoxalase superfamily metalloenzyme YdcJ
MSTPDHRFVPPHVIRTSFSSAMSDMYRKEVPLYGRLLEIVREINHDILQQKPRLEDELGSLERVSQERHGAIRLGTAAELRTMAEVFAVMAMYPVGYYDLSVAGLPVHSTAFRPIQKEELALNPFRVFTSLLRVDLLDPEIRTEAEQTLARRDIFTPRLRQLLEIHQNQGGFTPPQGDEFIREALETFRWHSTALVSRAFYEKLLRVNSLLADIVCFRGPHINHLTPRVLDIYRLHRTMETMQIETIPEVQGPPEDCPILLKQTSFKALNEEIQFPEGNGSYTGGKHRARFGEIELRECAITPEARSIYDRLIADVNRRAKQLRQEADEQGYRTGYPQLLNRIFREGFPAWTLEELRIRNLGYFHYHFVETADTATAELPPLDPSLSAKATLEKLIAAGRVRATPITYEDFLPVSAAGIFKSNLDEQSGAIDKEDPNQAMFEEALGRAVMDPFALYQQEEQASIAAVLKRFERDFASGSVS